MTFAELKRLKQQQQQQQQLQSPETPKSPRSIQVYDARPLSPRPSHVDPEETESEAELEEQIAAMTAEAERVKKKLGNLETNARSEEARMQALRSDAENLRKAENGLVADIKYARLELQFEKERVAKARQQKEKQLMVRRGAEGGVQEEMRVLQEQLAQETARGQSLVAEREAASEQVFRLEQTRERERAILARLQEQRVAPKSESEDLSHYRRELEAEKASLAAETEKIALLTVSLESEIRSNRAQIDETEAEFLRQIAKLKSTLGNQQ
jgi:chromosome segregation ATPase